MIGVIYVILWLIAIVFVTMEMFASIKQLGVAAVLPQFKSRDNSIYARLMVVVFAALILFHPF